MGNKKGTHIPTNKMAIGEQVTGVYCLNKKVLKGREKKGGVIYRLTLSDRFGEIDAEVSEGKISSEKDLLALRDKAVKVTGVVLAGKDTKPVLSINPNGICTAEKSDYKESDVFKGISDEYRKYYKGIILDFINKIPDESIKALVSAVLTKERLDRLGELPASLYYSGRYIGGALAVTAGVAKMAASAAGAYNMLQPNLYKTELNWSVLMGAALLRLSALPEALTNEMPFQKTLKAAQRGYMSILQDLLGDTIREKNIAIDEELYSGLYNTIYTSSRQGGLNPTSTEGIVLLSEVISYERLDKRAFALDREGVDEDRGYSYLDRVGYVVEGEEKVERSEAA